MPAFTLIAYREDGVDTCRNCVMDRSSSAFDLHLSSSLEEAAQFWADKRWEDQHRERAVCSWDITLLVDGLDEYDWEERHPDEVDTDHPFEAVRKLADERYAARNATAALTARRAEEAAQQRAEAARVAALAAREVQERAELARLQAKYTPV